MTNPGEPGDDEDLDSMMGSMRGMFREMPDDEPPVRGLDALMAAARTKAAEMAPEPEKESWWRRTLAMLTRPPMLAAATVIVLVGSTVVLTRRGDLDTAATERSVTRDAEPKTQAPVAASAERKGKVVAEGGGKVDLRTGEVKKDSNEKTEDRLGYGGVPGGPADRPVVTQRPRPPVVARPDAVPPEPVPEPVKIERPTVKPTDEEDPRIVTEGGEGLHSNGQQGQDKQPEAPTSDSETGTSRPPAAPTGGVQVSVPQLVKQAETAAGRKDCAAVRATAERIRKLDANAYKTRVVTQAAIKRCL